MMKKFLVLCLGVVFAAMTAVTAASAQTSDVTGKNVRDPGTYAILKTNMGAIVCVLFDNVAPMTVENFIGLAEGTKEVVDPKTGQKLKKKFFDGTIFHRVIPEFMVQGGDPTGTGMGGPGYEFKDEIKSLQFNKVGRLAMANSGPNTNGSQFFITVAQTPWLNGKHTIFGQVVEGQEVANNISRVQRGPKDRPMANIVLESVTIERVK